MKNWWIKGLRSLISFDEGKRLDLFVIFPSLRRFLAARHHFAQFRTVGDIIFIIILVFGLFGPQDPDRNFVTFLTWGILWPIVVLSWFFTGRMWCGLCPLPGLGVFLQKKGWTLNLKRPEFIHKYSVYFSVFLLAFIIWVEIVADLRHWPAGTAWLLFSIVVGATIMAVIFPGQSWCRHICPLGRISGAAATLAITEFRADHDKCRGCPTFACRQGTEDKRGCPVYLGAFSVRNNLHCLVCGHCLPLCDRNSPQLLVRNPYNELIQNKGRFVTCTFTVPFLLGTQLARFIREKQVYGQMQTTFSMSDPLLFSILMFICIGVVLLFIHLGTRTLTSPGEDHDFGSRSPMVPILIPMAFTGELVYRMDHFAEEIGDFIPTIGRQFDLSFLKAFSFSIPPFPVDILSAFLLMNAAIAGGYVLWRYALGEFEDYLRLKDFLFLHLLILLLLFAFLATIF